VLERYQTAGTYYISFGLMAGKSPSGPIFVGEDLKRAIEQGHELGCHTFSHCHSWDTPTKVFQEAIVKNADALDRFVPGARFDSISYPISEPHPAIKRAAAQHFRCCRGGGQSINVGTVDLSQLSCYFLEQAHGDFAVVRQVIDKTIETRGWLIFATHDIDSAPSRFGCTPEFFEKVVQYTGTSGLRVLPISKALDRLLNNNAAN
jgi:peptidoglycan/xylan/chitin deacetylase (PgdA/CDA1 family)